MGPHVLGLLEEMLDSGKTPEEVCRDCPELLPQVRQRWQELRRIDAQIGALLPEPGTPPGTLVSTPGPHAAGLHPCGSASALSRQGKRASRLGGRAQPGHRPARSGAAG